MRRIIQSKKLQHVRYDVRGPILVEAQRLEAEGHKILKLNIGNTAPFGFEAPESMVADIVHNLPDSQGYSIPRHLLGPHRGRAVLPVARADRDRRRGRLHRQRRLRAHLDGAAGVRRRRQRDPRPGAGLPAVDRRGALSGGTPVHYRCDEDNGWNPDLEDIESKITPNTHALVIINPNNPTGAVLQRGDGQGPWSTSPAATTSSSWPTRSTRRSSSTTPCTTTPRVRRGRRPLPHLQRALQGLPGLRLPGRLGHGVGPKHMAEDFLEGLTLLANMRMCANVPAQHAIQTALGGYQSITELVVPGGRFYEQSKLASRLLNEIPGVSCVEPRGALYCFPRLDPEVYPIEDDEAFVIDLLRAKKILVTHGTGFNWFEPDHFRLVTLPDTEDVLTEAIGRIADFLETIRN
jgi:alanine-synthesizing transaminase